MSIDPVRARDLFLAASTLPPEKHSSFLVESCGADTELLAKVMGLLEVHHYPQDRSLTGTSSASTEVTRDFTTSPEFASTPTSPSDARAALTRPGQIASRSLSTLSVDLGMTIAGRYHHAADGARSGAAAAKHEVEHGRGLAEHRG
jgi:hypothetical protein